MEFPTKEHWEFAIILRWYELPVLFCGTPYVALPSFNSMSDLLCAWCAIIHHRVTLLVHHKRAGSRAGVTSNRSPAFSNIQIILPKEITVNLFGIGLFWLRATFQHPLRVQNPSLLTGSEAYRSKDSDHGTTALVELWSKTQPQSEPTNSKSDAPRVRQFQARLLEGLNRSVHEQA